MQVRLLRTLAASTATLYGPSSISTTTMAKRPTWIPLRAAAVAGSVIQRVHISRALRGPPGVNTGAGETHAGDMTPGTWVHGWSENACGESNEEPAMESASISFRSFRSRNADTQACSGHIARDSARDGQLPNQLLILGDNGILEPAAKSGEGEHEA